MWTDSLGVRLSEARMQLRFSLWFVPAITTAIAAAVAITLIGLEADVDPVVNDIIPWEIRTESSVSSTMMGTIIGSTATVVGVTFSVTMVALTLASQQLSPRVLTTFLKDRINQWVLGIFVATFTYALIVHRSIPPTGESVPDAAVTFGLLLAFASLAMLIVFIHHMAHAIQVSTILMSISQESLRGMPRRFPAPFGRDGDADTVRPLEDEEVIEASAYGYVGAIRMGRLLALARDFDLVLRLDATPGDFVGRGAPLVTVWPGGAPIADRIRHAFVLGSRPTPDHDVRLPLRQIADIATKALSPGINDPTTATNCIDHLGVMLLESLRWPPPSPYRADETGTVRVIAHGPSFDDLLRLAFGQILAYGHRDARVLHRVLTTLAMLARHAEGEAERAALREVARAVSRSSDDRIESHIERFELATLANLVMAETRAGAPQSLEAAHTPA